MTHDSGASLSERAVRVRDDEVAIHAAVEILKTRHRVQSASAYTMLVQASVDLRRSVGATAAHLVEDSREVPSPRA